ncbi:MAG: glycosyltransferase family 2 protein [Wenzhouxiangellaceae bacterium]
MSETPAIVIPVFNAAEPLRRCLAAVRATVAADVPVIVIDDASTDPAVGEALEELAAGWRVIRRPDNRGFVATANQGMRAAGARDVVLLNSDTIPAGDWLERIRRCADADPAIASITPFTNNGEIASLPELCKPAPVPEDPEAWALACRRAGPPQYPDLPTAVGFCMYMRRACIERIGGFDEQGFGRGYGEENDWCMRAAEAGWRHVLCDDAFVAHQGAASFGPLGLGPGEDAMRALLERHPAYLERVQDFIRRDPLAPIRGRIVERITRGSA